MGWSRIVDVFNRKKQLEADVLETPLKRCLTTFDLTLLGIGEYVYNYLSIYKTYLNRVKKFGYKICFAISPVKKM